MIEQLIMFLCVLISNAQVKRHIAVFTDGGS